MKIHITEAPKEIEIDIEDVGVIEFGLGELSVSAESHYGSDYGGGFELNKELTKKLYEKMKEYYETP